MPKHDHCHCAECLPGGAEDLLRQALDKLDRITCLLESANTLQETLTKEVGLSNDHLQVIRGHI